MKKVMVLAICAAVVLVLSGPVWAVEIQADDVTSNRLPASYAKAVNGKIVYGNSPTAYSPDETDQILNAYGGSLSTEAAGSMDDPTQYCKVKDGKIIFGKSPTAYSPVELHMILTAYGFTLSAEDAAAMGDPVGYCKVKDGKIIFGKSPTAYSAGSLNNILNAYKKEGAAMPMSSAEPTAEPVSEPEAASPSRPAVEGCPDADGDGVCNADDACANTPEGVFVDVRGCEIELVIYFDYDKASIRSDQAPKLDEVASLMQKHGDLTLKLEGHTDSVASESYNQALSESRAKAVFNYLTNKGVDGSRLSWKGYGETRPAASNATEEGRAKNRRVELKPLMVQ